MTVPIAEIPTDIQPLPVYSQTQFFGISVYCDDLNQCYISKQDAHILDMSFSLIILFAAVLSIR